MISSLIDTRVSGSHDYRSLADKISSVSIACSVAWGKIGKLNSCDGDRDVTVPSVDPDTTTTTTVWRGYGLILHNGVWD